MPNPFAQADVKKTIHITTYLLTYLLSYIQIDVGWRIAIAAKNYHHSDTSEARQTPAAVLRQLVASKQLRMAGMHGWRVSIGTLYCYLFYDTSFFCFGKG